MDYWLINFGSKYNFLKDIYIKLPLPILGVDWLRWKWCWDPAELWSLPAQVRIVQTQCLAKSWLMGLANLTGPAVSLKLWFTSPPVIVLHVWGWLSFHDISSHCIVFTPSTTQKETLSFADRRFNEEKSLYAFSRISSNPQISEYSIR